LNLIDTARDAERSLNKQEGGVCGEQLPLKYVYFNFISSWLIGLKN